MSSRLEKACAPAFFGVVLIGVLLVPSPVRAEPLPWAPPPVNACGETGFDPRAREPDPNAPPPPLLPPTINIPVPVPQITPVPVPGPPPNKTRIDPRALPKDPCRNPCPDIRNDRTISVLPDPKDSEIPSTPAQPGNSGPAGGSASGSGNGSSGGSGRLNIPNVQITPDIEPIPIPIPGGPPLPPETPPPPVVHPAQPGPVDAAPSPRTVTSVDLVNQVTGHGSVNRTDMRWSLDGTDLGIMWQTKPGQVAVLFGDTFGKGWNGSGAGGVNQDWRSNVLAYSSQHDLSKGLTIDTMVQNSRCHATELLNSRKIKNFETTVIPTSGFALGSRQYISYMSVRRWGEIPGTWWTNDGGLAYSDDDGRTWVEDQYAKWDNMFGLDRFQVTTMVPHGDYVYMFGTPNGRIGVIGLARVPTTQLLNKSAYQYWVHGTWAPARENDATPLFPGLAGELSARYDDSTQQWQMVYLDSVRGAIVLRTAHAPQGAWTDEVPLVNTSDYPTAYGGFIHPWSTGKDLYFTISAWNSYNVYLMHATLNDPQKQGPKK
ncbi:DUF4185 domain-containing protein [Nocardia alni]|uniref:DUF4185 domain-containing protein n=1 Tax=Nocardia alni TaxID=2815723 RepID=UPI001C212491